MADYIRVAAVLRLVYSALALLAGSVVLLFFGGVAAIAGVFGVFAGGSPEAIALPALLGFIAALTLAAGVLGSLPGLLAGWGMLRFRPWARLLGIVLAFFDLFTFPIGTALGIYTLWALFHRESVEIFEYGGPIRY